MEELEISAKTVEEAVQQALNQLGASQDQVEVVVLRKSKSGMLGLGAEEAVVRVRRLDQLVAGREDIIPMAREVLETLLDLMKIPALVQVSEAPPEDSIEFNIKGEDLGILIGRRGQGLAALQYILRLITAHKAGARVSLSVDIEGYKKRRCESLRRLAWSMAEQVTATRCSVALESMPADERRIVHLALANHSDVTTQSIGMGEARKVAIVLKK